VVPNDGTVQPWTPLFTPLVLFTGKMDAPKFQVAFTNGGFLGRVSVPAYGLFSARNAAANSWWTDADQQRRFPGDLGCSRMPLYANGYRPIWFEG